MKRPKQRSKGKWLLMLLALAIFLFAIFQVFLYLKEYKNSEEEYDQIRSSFTAVRDPSGDTLDGNTGSRGENGETAVFEDAEPPLSVDWDGLKKENPDIVGWLYVDGQPSISYPIVQGRSNSEYLHMTYLRESLYAGSIFLNSTNAADFSDASSFVYGHNMRNGSMFGMLKFMMDQEAYEANPYFWVLTPEGDYRYHIFAALTTEDETEAFTVYHESGSDFAAWAKQMREQSVLDTDVPVKEGDRVVVLSTCKGAGTNMRNIVLGVLCSTARPKDHNYAEDNARDAFTKLADNAFPENKDTSYILTAKGTSVSISTRGNAADTLVRDDWNDVYTYDDGILIHYEMLTGDAEANAEMTDGSWRWSDENYSDIQNGTLHTEYLANGLRLIYRTNRYKIGSDTCFAETFGVVDMKGAFLKITVTEMRDNIASIKSGPKTLGALIDAVGWPVGGVSQG